MLVLALCAYSLHLGHALVARAPAPRMNVVDFMPFWENNFFTVEPTYTIRDWAAARSIMAEYLDSVRTERGAMFSGWTICDDKLFCREAFHDAGAVVAHMANVKPAIGKLLAGVATLESVELHGPPSDLPKCADAMAPFDAATRTFEIDSGCTFIVRPYAGMSRGQSHFSIHPRFTVSDWSAARPLLDETVARMKLVSGCIYFGWTRCGDDLVCRQAYTNAEGVRAHLDGVGALIEQLASGPATLDSVSVHGPSTRLGECKAVMGEKYGVSVSPRYFALDSGFQRFEITGYNLGMLDYSKFD